MSHHAKDISHWFAEIYGDDAVIPTRDPLPGPIKADVAIVGAGYTGLWTAYELLRSAPGLKVVLLEAKFVGYGPSGRNGGAAISQIVGSRQFWAKRGGREGAIGMERAVQNGVDEIGTAVAREGIECKFAKNGVLMLARTPLEVEHFRHSVEEDRKFGFTAEDTVYLEQADAVARINAANLLGAKFNSHCASIDPARLVQGLAAAVEKLGGTVYEQTRVSSIEPRRAITERGLVEAEFVIRATEAYTGWIDGKKRQIVPVHTTMIATEVISDALWSEINWAKRETVLAEHPFLHLQHTSDHRITIGGDDPRVPYRFGSATSDDHQPAEELQQHYYRQLIKLFPPLAGVKIAHSWSGVFGAPRDWAPSVGVDHSTGLGWGGGYVGEGVVPSNMAGRTLRDLILKKDTEMTALPWVRKHPRGWEPEPIRYIGSAAIFAARRAGENNEERTQKASKLLAAANRAAGFTGHLG
ncbi:MAG TPA: FAD-dependent oxidoreductase [Pseudolysinimonas sp.]|nr:FAD-dependent oxidoreductase [Pseudolysinimonas sp.]